jgi:predicted nucleic acid-binding protein
MKAFFDSSALAKRYIRERGSEKVASLLAEASEVGISLIVPLEIVSALNRLLRHGALSAADYSLAKSALLEDVEDMTVCNITVPVVERAIALLEEYSLKTLDALHLASALEWQAGIFVSSDHRQSAAAAASGLRVVGV